MTEKMTVDQIKPFKRELVVRVRDRNEFNNSPIYVPESSKNETAHFFDVVRVGEEVTEVKAGDVVMVKWGNTMTPTMWGSDYISVTSEEHIECVIDDE